MFTRPLLKALVATSLIAKSSASYSLVQEYSGKTFFDSWEFFTGTDPTSGYVKYTDVNTASASELIGFVDNNSSASPSLNAYIGVDSVTLNPTGGRNSVRISSNATFNINSLFIADVYHIPTGYGTWPALWLLGVGDQPWPFQGEVDWIEQIGGAQHNSMTLHTSAGCVVDQVPGLSTPDCATADDAGCSIAAPATVTSTSPSGANTLGTFGDGFNNANGGVWALLWTTEGISIWLFARDNIPADIASNNPDTSTWTTKPLANFSGAGCNFAERFQDMQLIINTDLCGSWAGTDWASSGAAKATGTNACQSYVAANPDQFKESFWQIASIKVFQAGASESAVQKRAEHGAHDVDMMVHADAMHFQNFNGSECANMTTHRNGHHGLHVHTRHIHEHNDTTPSLLDGKTTDKVANVGEECGGYPNICFGPVSQATQTATTSQLLNPFQSAAPATDPLALDVVPDNKFETTEPIPTYDDSEESDCGGYPNVCFSGTVYCSRASTTVSLPLWAVFTPLIIALAAGYIATVLLATCLVDDEGDY